MLSRWCFILIGDNDTGKTSFQRAMLAHLCNEHYVRLRRNILRDVVHPRAPSTFRTLFTANRSYQEKASEYRSVGNYFGKFFLDADVAILASHSHGDAIDDVRNMIRELQLRAYNVSGVFWSNDFGADARAIAGLPWQERIMIENPVLRDANRIAWQLERLGREFSDMLIERARVW